MHASLATPIVSLTLTDLVLPSFGMDNPKLSGSEAGGEGKEGVGSGVKGTTLHDVSQAAPMIMIMVHLRKHPFWGRKHSFGRKLD